MASLDAPESGGSSGTTNGSGNSGGSWFPSFSEIVGVPDVLTRLGSESKALLKDPRGYIILVLLEYLTGAVLDFAEAVLRLILQAFGITARAPILLANSILSAFSPVGTLLFGIVDLVFGIFASLIAGAGPAGPLILALLAAVLVRLLVSGSVVALNALTTVSIGSWAKSILTLEFLRGGS